MVQELKFEYEIAALLHMIVVGLGFLEFFLVD